MKLLMLLSCIVFGVSSLVFCRSLAEFMVEYQREAYGLKYSLRQMDILIRIVAIGLIVGATWQLVSLATN